ncbi:hypothetical protein ACFPN7_14785 [Amycolatopsis halotolerans]
MIEFHSSGTSPDGVASPSSGKGTKTFQRKEIDRFGGAPDADSLRALAVTPTAASEAFGGG